MGTLQPSTTGAHVVGVRPFNRELSATLDRLIIALEEGNPGRWRKRVLLLRKLVAEHRALGGAK